MRRSISSQLNLLLTPPMEQTLAIYQSGHLYISYFYFYSVCAKDEYIIYIKRNGGRRI